MQSPPVDVQPGQVLRPARADDGASYTGPKDRVAPDWREGRSNLVVMLAQVWHHWISLFLLVPAVILVVALGIGYLVKVESLKYPRRQQ